MGGETQMQDILMYISDQHAWLQQGYRKNTEPGSDCRTGNGHAELLYVISTVCSGQNVDDERPDSKPL